MAQLAGSLRTNVALPFTTPGGVGGGTFTAQATLPFTTPGGILLACNRQLAGTAIAAPSVPDVTDPVVAFVSPAPGSQIAPDTAIVLQATDENLVNVTIDVTYPDGTSEMIFDGDTFTPLYAGLSTRSVITDGFQFTIKRKRGGWPATPAFNIEAVDASGNRST